MTTPNQDVLQIRGVLQAFTDALHRRDAAAAVAVYADDAVAYDLAPPLSIEGERLRDPAGIQSWFDTWKSPIESTAKELTIRRRRRHRLRVHVATHGRHQGRRAPGRSLVPRHRLLRAPRRAVEDRARPQLGAVRDGRQRPRAARSEAPVERKERRTGAASADGERHPRRQRQPRCSSCEGCGRRGRSLSLPGPPSLSSVTERCAETEPAAVVDLAGFARGAVRGRGTVYGAGTEHDGIHAGTCHPLPSGHRCSPNPRRSPTYTCCTFAHRTGSACTRRPRRCRHRSHCRPRRRLHPLVGPARRRIDARRRHTPQCPLRRTPPRPPYRFGRRHLDRRRRPRRSRCRSRRRPRRRPFGPRARDGPEPLTDRR